MLLKVFLGVWRYQISFETMFWLIWVKNWAVEAQKFLWADSTPLRPIDWLKSLAWLGLIVFYCNLGTEDDTVRGERFIICRYAIVMGKAIQVTQLLAELKKVSDGLGLNHEGQGVDFQDSVIEVKYTHCL